MAEEFTVNPWEVKGDINYEKLIKQFGLTPLKNVPEKLNELAIFRRGIVFAHRDFDKISERIRTKKPFVMMTGLMPSGRFHFGHKMVAEQFIQYQKLGAKVYITVADIEAYVSRIPDLKEVRRIAIEEYLTNYVALGLNLDKCDFYFQSKRNKDGIKANAYYSLAALLSRHATFNEFQAVYGEISPGKMSASLLQASDMLHAQLPEFEGKLPVVVPVGTDQDPHIRLARDMASRINAAGTCNFDTLASTYHIFMPGLKGGKMSSSDPLSHIALTETPKEAETKIKKYAFSGGRATLEEHRKLGGNPDVDVSFQMLRYGLEPDDKKLAKIKEEYESGKLLSGEMKTLAVQKVCDFLEKHQQKRADAKDAVKQYIQENDL